MKKFKLLSRDTLIGSVTLGPHNERQLIGTLAPTEAYSTCEDLVASYSIIACDLRARQLRADEFSILARKVKELDLNLLDQSGKILAVERIELTDIRKWSGGGTPIVVTVTVKR